MTRISLTFNDPQFLLSYIRSKTILKENGCENWTGCTDKGGYGKIEIQGITYRVPRVVLYLNGILPSLDSDIQVRHTCDNTTCIKDKHLITGTAKDNFEDCKNRGRNHISQVRKSQTHCIQGHEYTPENTYWRFDGRRQCQKCKKEARKRYNDSKLELVIGENNV